MASLKILPSNANKNTPLTKASSNTHSDPTDESDDETASLFTATINAIDTDLGIPLDTTDVIGESIPEKQESEIDCVRAQMDTGAAISCCGSEGLPFLHSYSTFSQKSPCPIKMGAAFSDADAVPHGYGYLHVPAHNKDGFLRVLTFYHPKLRTTLVNEKDLIRGAGFNPKRDMKGELWTADYKAGTFTFASQHKLKDSLHVVVHGILQNGGKYYTAPLIPADSDKAIQQIKQNHGDFVEQCEKAFLYNIYGYQENEYAKLKQEFKRLPTMYHSIPFHQYIQTHTPVHAIRKETERLLWHQRLGHPSDYYLYNAHKHITGVPKFKHMDPILDSCPTCIRAKQTKEPAGSNTTRTATVPYQGLSIDFSFAGAKSKNENRATDFVGFNGETCWILVSDHFSRMKHGDTRVTKASPLDWLETFLRNHAPNCHGKYVFLDQGGELYANPKVVDLFKRFGYAIRPTGADASNQNGPVERGHLAVANGIRSLLGGANLDIHFWPYAFHHWLRIDNSIPSRDQTMAPLTIAHNIVDDFSAFRTFGCRVWVRPPGNRKAKFRISSKKGLFLGFMPNTTTNILWYDPETNRVKIAKHARFDEGMNDLPLEEVPPNVVHLQRTQFSVKLPIEKDFSSVPQFDIGSTPFFHTITRTMTDSCRHATFGLTIETDELTNRAYISHIRNQSSAAKLFSTPKSTNSKLRGSFLVKIDNIPVFTKQEVLEVLRRLRDCKVRSFDLELHRKRSNLPNKYEKPCVSSIFSPRKFPPSVTMCTRCASKIFAASPKSVFPQQNFLPLTSPFPSCKPQSMLSGPAPPPQRNKHSVASPEKNSSNLILGRYGEMESESNWISSTIYKCTDPLLNVLLERSSCANTGNIT